jgi:hypothetical protein
MKSLISEWILGRVPAVNAVILANGRVHRFRPVDPPRIIPFLLKTEKEEELDFTAEIFWTSALPFDTASNPKTEMVAVAGECGMGSDGFIALQKNASRNSLLWIAFFDFSNPFESVRFEGDTLIARNNLDEEWRLKMAEPWRVSVTQTTS